MVNIGTQNGEEILALTKDLIRIPSVTSNLEANKKILDRAHEELPGYSVEEFTHPDDSTKSLLFYNTETRPEKFRILLHGHLDVVPAQDESQFTPTERGRRLYGRGAQDMKSGAAALITVFKHLARSLPYSIALSLTTDEEVGGFNGAGYQAQEGVMADFVISGESSTNFAIGNQHKGVLLVHASSHTVGGHTAYNGDKDNALQQQINFLSEVNELIPGADGVWRTTASVTKIDTTNIAHNVVPSDAHSAIAIRYIFEDDPDTIYEKIKAINPNIEVRRDEKFGLAHDTPPQHPDIVTLREIISQVTRNDAVFEGRAGSSDLRHWTEKGSEGIDFGPSGGGLHTSEEYTEIGSLVQYAQIIQKFLTSLG